MMADLVGSKGAVVTARDLSPDLAKALDSCFGIVEVARAIQTIIKDPEIRKEVTAARTLVAELTDPNSAFHQQLRSHAEAFRRVHAVLNDFFRSPQAAEIGRWLRILAENNDRKPFSRLPKHFERAQSNILEMTDVAFVQAGDESGSLAGFLEVQAMGSALQVEDGFAPEISDALRQDLGFVADAGSAALLPSQGYRFDGSLTCFPRATFDIGLRRAGLLDGAQVLLRQYGPTLHIDPSFEQDLNLNTRLYRILCCLEQAVRNFLDRKMVETYGPTWAKSRTPNGMLDQWEKTRNGRPLSAVNYAEFSDYTSIITRADNWNDLFVRYFHRMADVRESFERLRIIRNTTMHSRTATQEDELTVLSEVTRLLKAISRDPAS